MDQIKRRRRSLSLRKSLILYVGVFALLAVALSAGTGALCSSIGNTVRGKAYAASPVEKYYLTNEQGERLGEGTYISKEPVELPEKTERLMALLELFPMAAVPVYSAACILAAALLFYRNKLKEPLARLRTASEKISVNDLDFSVDYDSGDELGQLCASFELMRSTLADNFAGMWRQVEERKQLNAAFAHDLRTPLTVLKGYNEMLLTDGDDSTRRTAATMGKHLSRMEAYVDSMSRLQRLEDAQPEQREVQLQPFRDALREDAEIVCGKNGKRLILEERGSLEGKLSFDAEFVDQVCHNLLANAVRYARTSVTLILTVGENGLELSVSDDGEGFDSKSLSRAAEPYFTGESDRFCHFGLGLYICRLLCERHGGWLRVENLPNGGARVTAFFAAAPVL